MEVVAHVNTEVAGAVIAAVGALIFCVITCEAVAEHPFALVTVTVYVPAEVTLSVALVPTTAVPLDQE